MDLAVNIAIGSSAQIALFVAPVLVIASFFIGAGADAAGLQRVRARRGPARDPDRATWSPTTASRTGSRASSCSASTRSSGSPSSTRRYRMDVVFLLAQLRRHPGRRAAVHQRDRVGRASARLGEGATGSLLAAVGTAMPETLIPIVAILGGGRGGRGRRGRRDHRRTLPAGDDRDGAGRALGADLPWPARAGRSTCAADVATLDRDLIFFLVFFALGIAAGLVAPGRRCRSRWRSSS